jgi:hypothetical protein
VTCDPGAGSTFPIGTTTVSCQSTDAHGNTGVASFTIAVRGASQQINVLAASLAGIGGGSFARQLSSVQQAFSSGRTTAACGALNAFMNHVRAQSGKQVTTAQADQALAAARRVAAVMGC